jgi:hypothetical protein
MGIGSWWHWIILLFVCLPFLALPIWPAWRICKRAGFAGPWALFILFPLLGLFMAWIFAFVQWPIDRRSAQVAK